MYRSNRLRKETKPPSAPRPVFVSQKPLQVNTQGKNVNEEEVLSSQDQNNEIPSSQNENIDHNPLPSQSRFLSQRYQISRLTQDVDLRGKNYFEIALISCKIQITDFGEFYFIS